MADDKFLTGRERTFADDEIIVSKTDLAGRITYGNRIFIEFSGYDESELLGTQHNIIRHPDMPRSAFKLAWSTIAAGKEFFENPDHTCAPGPGRSPCRRRAETRPGRSAPARRSALDRPA